VGTTVVPTSFTEDTAKKMAKYPETKKGQYSYKGKSVIEKSENEMISFSEDAAEKKV